jgi:hypothetical protein
VITPPKKLPIDLTEVNSSKGAWLIAVESVTETRADGNALVKIVLEQVIDEDHFRARSLGMLLPVREAVDPDRCQNLVSQILKWIDSTEGDGFVDLTHRPA